MWAISYCHFWDCISFFFVHFSTDSFIPGAKGGTSIFSRLSYFSLFLPLFLYEFTWVADFILWVIIEVTHSVTGTPCLCYDWSSLNILDKLSNLGTEVKWQMACFLWLPLCCGYHHTPTLLITFLTQPNSPQINQSHPTHIFPINWLPSHTSKFALYEFV